MNDETSIETPITPDMEINAFVSASELDRLEKLRAGEASPEEAEVFITEDTADHSVTIH